MSASVAGVALYCASVALGAGAQPPFGDWIYHAVLAIPAALCLIRAALVPQQRAAWLLFGAALTCWFLGDVYWTAFLAPLDPQPYPSPADFLYLAFYPLAFAGLVVLVRMRGFRGAIWMDVAIAALATGAVLSAVLIPAVQESATGSAAAVITNVSYPAADVILLGALAAFVALAGWRVGRTWYLLGAGVAVFVIADSAYLLQVAADTYQQGTWIDPLWLVGTSLVGFAAWQSLDASAELRPRTAAAIALPAAFGLVALIVLLMDDLVGEIGLAGDLFAFSTLALLIVRMAVVYIQNDRLHRRAAATEERYRRVVESATEGITTVDTEGRLTFVNERFADMLGYPSQRLIGHHPFEFIPDSRMRDEVADRLAAHGRGEEATWEFQVPREDGAELWLLAKGSPMNDADGRPAGAVTMFTDVTERRRGQEALRESRQLLQTIVDSTNAIIYLKDSKGRYLVVNRAFEQLWGMRREDAIGKTGYELFPKDIADVFDKSDRAALEAGHLIELEDSAPLEDGVHTYLSAKFPVLAADGTPRGSGGISTDITARNRAEEALRESEQRFRLAVESTGVMLYTQNRDLHYTWVSNPPPGFTVDGMLGKTAAEVLGPDQGNATDEMKREVLATGEGRRTEVRADTANGPRRFSVLMEALRDEAGATVGITAAVLDVTDQREAKERFRVAFEDAPIGMALANVEDEQLGRYLRVNESFCRITGYRETELLSRTPEGLSHPEDRRLELDEFAQLISGQRDRYEIEKRLIQASGATIHVLVSCSIVRDADGAPLYAIKQVEDVTERRRVEQELKRLATHDSLTGLLNRRRFEAELEKQLTYSARYDTPGALLMLDLDGFKTVNDTLGHDAGDDVLKAATQAVARRLRETDTLGRLGGDEFVVLLPRSNERQAMSLASDLVRAVREGELQAGEQTVHLTASVGVAPFNGDRDVTPDELLEEADQAMYAAKRGGRDRAAAYDAQRALSPVS